MVTAGQVVLPDFEAAAKRFAQSGWNVTRFADAMWQFSPGSGHPRLHLVVTAGVHGDETAPIEMLAKQLPRWADSAEELNIILFVAIGNLDAVHEGKRFVSYDMNRMFAQAGNKFAWGAEGERANLLAHTLSSQIREGGDAPCVHLDLHTTIRPSRKATFAIVPGDDANAPLLRWLESAGLHAAVMSPGPNSTLSAFTARRGAASCTVELGQVGAFGANEMSVLDEFSSALDALVRRPAHVWSQLTHRRGTLETYRVTRELVRTSEHFELLISGDAANFERLRKGQLVARDGVQEICALRSDECVLFPNPRVAVGLRAGLLVAPMDSV